MAQTTDTLVVIPNWLEFIYHENTGAAFGILQNATWLFVLTTSILCIAIIVLLFKYKHHTAITYICTVLIVAGGLGNLIDRVKLGYVIDFIHVLFFDYIFNFADCMVVVGVILFGIYYIFFMSRKKEDDFVSILDEKTEEKIDVE